MMTRCRSCRQMGQAGNCPAGFTLMELLIVIAIIALLLAILLPSLSEGRKRASRLSCASHLRLFGQALNMSRTEYGRYPHRESEPVSTVTFSGLDNVGNLLPKQVVSSFLGRPDAMYCPTSLEKDRYASRPYKPSVTAKGAVRSWETGAISYIYLADIENKFEDEHGNPTFNPQLEAPNIGRSARLVLTGDRTVELTPRTKHVPGSNHGREGGWFCFTTGDVQWWPWERLTPHPTKMYLWYWPRTCKPLAPVPVAAGD